MKSTPIFLSTSSRRYRHGFAGTRSRAVTRHWQSPKHFVHLACKPVALCTNILSTRDLVNQRMMFHIDRLGIDHLHIDCLLYTSDAATTDVV